MKYDMKIYTKAHSNAKTYATSEDEKKQSNADKYLNIDLKPQFNHPFVGERLCYTSTLYLTA